MSEIDVWLPLGVDPALAAAPSAGWRPVGRLRRRRHAWPTPTRRSRRSPPRLAGEFPDTNRDWTARVGTTRDALAGANTWVVLSLLSRGRAAAGAGLRQHHEPADRAADRTPPGTGGAHRARRHPRPRRAADRRREPAARRRRRPARAGHRRRRAARRPRGRHRAVLPTSSRFDVRVVGFAFALAFVAPLVFAIVPTLRVLRHDVRGSLNDASARSVGGASAARGRSALVVVQVSLAVMLLVVAGLVVQSMRADRASTSATTRRGCSSREIDVPTWKAGRRRRRPAPAPAAGRAGRARFPASRGRRSPRACRRCTSRRRRPFDIAGRESTPTAIGRRPGVVVTRATTSRVLGVPMVAGRAFAAGRRRGAASRHRRLAGGGATLLGRRRRSDWRRRSAWPPRTGGRRSRPRSSAWPATPPTPTSIERPQPVLFLLDEHRPTRRLQVVVRAAAPGGSGRRRCAPRSRGRSPTCRPTSCAPSTRASKTRTRRTGC